MFCSTHTLRAYLVVEEYVRLSCVCCEYRYHYDCVLRLLRVFWFSKKTLGDRAFSVAAPNPWIEIAIGCLK